MSTGSTVVQAEGSAASATLAALLVELEGVLVETRTVVHKAATAALGNSLTRAIFTQYGLHGSFDAVARALVDRSGSSADAADLSARIAKAVSSHLASAPMSAGIDKVLREATKRGIPAAIVTAFPEGVAQALVDRLGLTERGVKVIAFAEEDKAYPRADIWLKAAKSLGKPARFCVAFTASQPSCKTALSSGMRCVAVPDSFTGHQDYSGADCVVDSWDDVTAPALLDDVVPMIR